jgi:membrane protein implicated in regulation of membrane protease activity
MNEILTVAFVALLAAVVVFNVADGLAIALGSVLGPPSRWILKHFFGIDRPRAGADSLVGKRALAQGDFTRAAESGLLEGYVVIDGERWRARAADGTQHLASGEALDVSGREGLVLLVSHVEGE